MRRQYNDPSSEMSRRRGVVVERMLPRVEWETRMPSPGQGDAIPQLSVVMPAHNAAPYVDASIESILTQTFTDFELVVADDGSTDGTPGLLRDWVKRDRRVRLVECPTRLGPAGIGNLIVRHARAPVCARMDADDISCPTRLEAEWQVLQANPDASLIGTLWEGIDAAGRLVRPRDRWRLIRRSAFAPFPHGSIMFRRQAYESAGGYRAMCNYWEDLDLYFRLAAHGRVLVLPAPLYRYRFHDASVLGGPIRSDEERATELMVRCLAVRRAGGDYSALIAGGHELAGPPSLSPISLYLFASRRLWAGTSPGILRRLSAVRPRRPLRLWLCLLLLATAGDFAPRQVRASLAAFVRCRDAWASARVPDGTAVEWRFE
jgi:GT2 family glycosyltransferase